MSEVPFHQTRLGRVFFEATLPELVRQLTELNERIEHLATVVDQKPTKPDHSERRGPQLDGTSLNPNP